MALRSNLPCVVNSLASGPDPFKVKPGITTRMWIPPSPSGANGSYPLVDLIRELRAFREAIGQSLLR
jgi:hypothetical protein